jgi:hypothetical protein
MAGSGNEAFPLKYGRDQVCRRGEDLVIYSACENPGWEVREHRGIGVLIGEDVWRVAAKETARNGVRYTLAPWPDHLHQIPGRMIRYDEEYVRIRDAARIRDRRLNAGAMAIAPFKPFIGFLPSAVKARLEEIFGLPSRSATFASIVLEFFLTFVAGVFSLIGDPFSFFGASWWSYWAFLILPADIIMRFDSYLRGSFNPPGFYEWAASLIIWIHKRLNQK